MFACNDTNNDLEDGLYAEFDTTMGVILVKLTYEKTPVTVANFVALAEGNHPKVREEYKGIKFYDGLIFHRVINNFMIQGGDPVGNGSGGPGYKFLDEFDQSLLHNKSGVLSMANSGPGTNGSQFFITEVPTPHLDFKHSVFGQVVEGIEIQDEISNVKTAIANRPEKDIIIKKLTIIRKGSKAKKFDEDGNAIIDKKSGKQATAGRQTGRKEYERVEGQILVITKIDVRAGLEKFEKAAGIAKEESVVNNSNNFNKMWKDITVGALQEEAGSPPTGIVKDTIKILRETSGTRAFKVEGGPPIQPDDIIISIGTYARATRVKKNQGCLLYTSPSPRD